MTCTHTKRVCTLSECSYYAPSVEILKELLLIVEYEKSLFPDKVSQCLERNPRSVLETSFVVRTFRFSSDYFKTSASH